jgi:hypothetical protein
MEDKECEAYLFIVYDTTLVSSDKTNNYNKFTIKCNDFINA